MAILLCVLMGLSLCAVCALCWGVTKLHREQRTCLREARDEMGRLRIDVKILLAHAERVDEAARLAQRERDWVVQQVGSFLPDDATASRLERDHRQAERRFLSSRTPPSPLSKAFVPSGPSTPAGTRSPRP